MYIYLSNEIRNIHYFGDFIVIICNDNKHIIIKKKLEIFIIEKVMNGIELEKLSIDIIKNFSINGTVSNIIKLLQNHFKEYPQIYTNEVSQMLKRPVLTGKKGKYYPYRIQIELTSSCNLNCSHCYKNANEYQKYLSYNSIEKLLLYSNNAFYEIGLTGGEPLLHPNFNIIASICYKYSHQLELNTNGLLLSQISIDILQLFKYISISLYGLTDEDYNKNTNHKGGYTKLKESCLYLAKNGIPFNLSVIPKKDMLPELESYVKSAILLGAKTLQFGTVNKIGRGNDLNEMDNWCSTREDINYMYRQIRLLSQKYCKDINIIPWNREQYSTPQDNNSFSIIYPNNCFFCTAGTLQWGINEEMRFKPCVIWPDSLTLPYEKWIHYLEGEKELDWQKYIQDLKKYCEINYQSIESFCDRLKWD